MPQEIDEHGYPVIQNAALRGAVLEAGAEVRKTGHLWLAVSRAASRWRVNGNEVLRKLRERQAAGQRMAAVRRAARKGKE